MAKTLISFTLDNLGDAADLYRKNITAPRAPGTNYALEVGVPALLDLYRRHQLPFTYFVEGWSAERYPDLVRDIKSHGADVGMHGWQHEIWHLLADEEVDSLVKRAHASLTEALGQPPTTFRAPGGKTTPYTQQLLANLGYTVDASFQDHALPSRAVQQLVNVPYLWPGVDATHWLWHKRSPEAALQQWIQDLDSAAATQTPLIFIFHSHVMGMQPARLAIGEQLIQYVRNDPRFAIVSLAEIRTQFLQTTL